MKKKFYCAMSIMMIMAVLLLGCADENKKETLEEQENKGTEILEENAETELEEIYVSPEEDEYVPSIVELFSEETPYQQLADFLISYYQIPEEYQPETRYYYNYVDLNNDGMMEIFAVVVGEYTEQSSGDPAVILSVDAAGQFVVMESFAGIHTPVTVSVQTTNGWRDIVYYAYGGGEKDGYRICRYNPEGGYQTELSETVEKMEPISGDQILSNNLIDDMDQGKYLTLAPQVEMGTE